jgi:hypothetical protein
MRKYDKREGVYVMGDTLFMHGFSGSVGSVNTVRGHVLDYGQWSVIMGHIHSPDTITVAGHPMPRMGQSSGCLCELDFEYNRTHIKTLRQRHGFIYGVYDTRTRRHQTYSTSPVSEGPQSVWVVTTKLQVL